VDFVRARTKEQISSRQEEIISACDVLFNRHGYEGVNFKAISEITSFKRPTIYSYYKTKDEVLLDLLKREMLDWDASMQKMIQTTEIMTKEQYCTFLMQNTVFRDKMFRLLAILCTNIENQCRLEKLAEFKKEAVVAFSTIRESLDKYFPQSDTSKKEFFMAVFLSCVHGLYPIAFPTKKPVDAMVMAGMKYTPIDFKDTFYRCLLLLVSDL
jgi:AcrR family transcriptional regulator